MSNKITEQFFTHEESAESLKDRALAKIKADTGFEDEKLIFCGQIYQPDKVGSLIYQGKYQGKPAVLKIQGMPLAINEIDIIEAFNRQNKSHTIRLPEIYRSSQWNKDDGYNFLIMESVSRRHIYRPPLATPEEREEFCDFYQEYKTNAITEPFLDQAEDENCAVEFISKRVEKWAKIVDRQKKSSYLGEKYRDKFVSLLDDHSDGIKMDFMHGHLTVYDILKTNDNGYVLTSNIFWGWRQQWYDTTFHLWSGIKSIGDLNMTSQQVIEYVEKWLVAYKQLLVCAADPDFEKKFSLNMLERCVGALLLDLENQGYVEKKAEHVAHLSGIFVDLFEHFAKKLQITP